MKVVLITGASSGIGYESAKLLAKSGYKVYAGARRTERMEKLNEYGVAPVALDVTDQNSCENAVRTVNDAEGRIMNTPENLAALVKKIIEAKNSKTRYQDSAMAKMSVFMSRHTSDKFMDKMMINMI